MSYAGHLPTCVFDLDTWQRMRVWEPECEGLCAPDGFSRTRDGHGKPIVVYIAPIWSMSYAVRPIVRVKMGRREVSWSHQTLYEWWNGLDRAPAGRRLMGRWLGGDLPAA